MTSEYPRESYMPMECYVVVADYRPADDSYEVLANFQGPFSTHPVMARALRVPGTRFRVKTPADSGGSFGIKLSVFPFMVLMSLASKVCGRPVKWVEDRLEHLVAASSGPNRITEIEAAVANDGRILALRLDQCEDYGAFLRAPMPGPLYRMHGALTGAYDIANLEVTNRCVLTNKAPSSLIRGFGGPQLYPGARAAGAENRGRIGARSSRRDPEAISFRPARFPTRRRPARSTIPATIRAASRSPPARDGSSELIRRRDAARAAGRHYGIGFAAVVEPGMSNMGYLSTLLSPEAREKSGPKNGAVSMATVNVDPLGAVSVTADVTVQGQGHETVLSQIVADELGLRVDDVRVNLELDTAATEWSIAAGTYSCRFTPGTAVAAHLAAKRIKAKLARIGAKQLNVLADDVELVGGKIRSKSNPDNALPFGRVAGTAHWSPIMLPDGMEPGLRETGVWAPPELEPPSHDDRINTSLTYGFVFDMCGIEIDPVTCEVRVDKYVTMHDAGRLLNPLIAEGQFRGAFVQGLAVGALRGVRLRRWRRIPVGHVRRLHRADRDGAAGAGAAAHRDAVAVHAARRQGARGRQLHERAGVRGECDRRCAGRGERDAAGDAGAHSRDAGGRGAGAAGAHRGQRRGLIDRGQGEGGGADHQGRWLGDSRGVAAEGVGWPARSGKPARGDPRLSFAGDAR